MRGRRSCLAQEEQRRPQGTVRRQKHGSILDVPRQGQELLSECVCRLVLGADERRTPESPQHGKKLVRLVQVLTALSSRRVCLSYFGSCPAFGRNQRYA